MSDSKANTQIGTTGASGDLSIEVTTNGPLRLRGASQVVQQFLIPDAKGASVAYQEGESYETKATVTLCRCGLSGHKPFCDGSHSTAAEHGIDLTETASHAPSLDTAQTIRGPEDSLTDDQKLCAFARFCDQIQQIWNVVQMPGAEAASEAVEMAHHCPSGRLIVWDNETQAPIESQETPEVWLIEDLHEGCSGPIALRGGIPVVSGDGSPYEVRNRQTLCRCGHSRNKPFCDGTHASVQFQDGLPTTPLADGKRA